METIEKEIKRKKIRANIQKAILGTLATAGLVSMAVLAPNSLQLLKPLLKYNKKKNHSYTISRSITSLLEQGMIVIEMTEKGKFVRLTEKGKTKLELFLASEKQIPLNKKWDGKWRVVIYDIKEYKKNTRNKLQMTLKSVGFKKLQNSIWIFPHPCETLITLLKADFHIGKEILYMVVEKLENDWWLKKEFGLK